MTSSFCPGAEQTESTGGKSNTRETSGLSSTTSASYNLRIEKVQLMKEKKNGDYRNLLTVDVKS